MAFLEFSEKFKTLLRKPALGLQFEFNPDHNSVKYWIEYFSIPHTEVANIFVQNRDVEFNYRPGSKDRVYVERLIGPVDVTQPTLLRPVAFLKNHFIVDECVASLAPKLRMLGCDTLQDSAFDDKDIVEIANQERRVILSKDRGLLKRKEALWGHFVESTGTLPQFEEVVNFFDLSPLPTALARCLSCNGILQTVDKSEILSQLEPKTILYFNEFSRCSECGKIYWEGSHFQELRKTLEQLL
jgi:uncharacterized protein with PIN domain